MSRRWPRLLFYFVALIAAAADQGSKAWATVSLPGRPLTLIPGVLDFRYLTGGNTGIAFGLFQGQIWLVAVFMVILAGVAIYYARGLDWGRWEPNLVGGCLVGGAAGNLIDRVRLGHVVDFIDLHAGPHHWPTFNVADSLVCVAVGWIVIRQLRSPAAAPSR